jgi:DHA3 family macrolide efflux protein-like MFS transporter
VTSISADKTVDAAPSAVAGGMRTFTVLALGQFVSLMGSSLTTFALGIWIYQDTKSVSLLSWVILAASVPGVMIAPLAGTIVDRWNRRTVMLLSDLVAGISTVLVAAMIITGQMLHWHIFVLAIVNSLVGAFQEPAYSASVPLLVPKRHLGRASGFVQLSQGLARIVTPLLAGYLLVASGIGLILLIDVATFLFAVVTLAVVRIPSPAREPLKSTGTNELVHDAGRAIRFLWERTGLLSLLALFTCVNFVVAFVNVLYIPLILSFATEDVLGRVLTLGGLGMLLGSIACTALGTPQRKIASLMGLLFLGGIVIAATGLKESAILIASAGFLMMLILPVLQATSQVLWQTKVPPAMQGRVFALRRTLTQCSLPAAYLAAGPLADYVFEPLMRGNSNLAISVGSWIGHGEGRGIALLYIAMGLSGCFLAILGFAHPRIRNIEKELPDQIGEGK